MDHCSLQNETQTNMKLYLEDDPLLNTSLPCDSATHTKDMVLTRKSLSQINNQKNNKNIDVNKMVLHQSPIHQMLNR